jgi:hypothetical protein
MDEVTTEATAVMQQAVFGPGAIMIIIMWRPTYDREHDHTSQIETESRTTGAETVTSQMWAAFVVFVGTA